MVEFLKESAFVISGAIPGAMPGGILKRTHGKHPVAIPDGTHEGSREE